MLFQFTIFNFLKIQLKFRKYTDHLMQFLCGQLNQVLSKVNFLMCQPQAKHKFKKLVQTIKPYLKLKKWKNGSFKKYHPSLIEPIQKNQNTIDQLMKFMGISVSRCCQLDPSTLKNILLRIVKYMSKVTGTEKKNIIKEPKIEVIDEQNLNERLLRIKNNEMQINTCPSRLFVLYKNQKYHINSFKLPVKTFHIPNSENGLNGTNWISGHNKKQLAYQIAHNLNHNGVIFIGCKEQNGYMIPIGLKISEQLKQSLKQSILDIFKTCIAPLDKRFIYNFIQFVPLAQSSIRNKENIQKQSEMQGIYVCRINCFSNQSIQTSFRVIQLNKKQYQNIQQKQEQKQKNQKQKTKESKQHLIRIKTQYEIKQFTEKQYYPQFQKQSLIKIKKIKNNIKNTHLCDIQQPYHHLIKHLEPKEGKRLFIHKQPQKKNYCLISTKLLQKQIRQMIQEFMIKKNNYFNRIEIQSLNNKYPKFQLQLKQRYNLNKDSIKQTNKQKDKFNINSKQQKQRYNIQKYQIKEINQQKDKILIRHNFNSKQLKQFQKQLIKQKIINNQIQLIRVTKNLQIESNFHIQRQKFQKMFKNESFSNPIIEIRYNIKNQQICKLKLQNQEQSLKAFYYFKKTYKETLKFI